VTTRDVRAEVGLFAAAYVANQQKGSAATWPEVPLSTRTPWVEICHRGSVGLAQLQLEARETGFIQGCSACHSSSPGPTFPVVHFEYLSTSRQPVQPGTVNVTRTVGEPAPTYSPDTRV
jgi:hypothetical protein